MAAVTGSRSCCSQPPPQPQHLPKSFDRLTVSYSGTTESQSHICHSTSTPVTHRALCPSLRVPHRPGGCLFQGISCLEHSRDGPSVPSPSPVTWGWRTLTIKFAQVGILERHPPFPLIKIVSHLILKGITARLPILEIQNRALFMPAQRPTPAPDCPFLLLSQFNISNIPGELRCIIALFSAY